MTVRLFSKHKQWWVLATLFLVTFINYFDRQTLGCAIEPVCHEFGLNNEARGQLLAAFVTTYALMHLFVGFFIDRIRRVKLFLAIMVSGWSLCTIMGGFARTYSELLLSRHALGVFEAVNFPICLMIIARIFPAKQRTLASGLFGSGAFLATLAAPSFTISLSNAFSWRYAFFGAGLLGLLWLIPWLLIYKDTPPETDATHTSSYSLRSFFNSFKQVLSQPLFWGITAIGFGIVPCLYFCTQWLPSYFVQALHQTYDGGLAEKLTVISLFQDAGMWVSGGLVFWLAGKGRSVLGARKTVMTIGYVLMMSVLVALLGVSPWGNVVIFSIFIFGLGMILANQHAFKQDVLPAHVATVAALVGFCETLFTSLVLKRIGVMTADSSYTTVIWMLAGFATFALLSLLFILRKKWVHIT